MIIKAAPDEFKERSDRVIDDVRDIRKQWGAIADIVNGIRNYWEGEASDEHLAIYEDIADEADELIRGIEDKLVKLRAMAGVYDEAGTAAETQASKLPSEVF